MNFKMFFDKPVYLEDEDGNEVEFKFRDLIMYNGAPYAVLAPVENDNQLVILKIDIKPGGWYTGVHDQETIDAIYAIYISRNNGD